MVQKIIRGLGIIFIVVAVVVWLTGSHPISSVVDPSSTSQYDTILDGYNEGFRIRRIKCGTVAEFRFPSERESISGEYALSDVAFMPTDPSFAPWECEEKPRTWGSTMSGDMESFDVSVMIPVPDDARLEGKTVEGKLEMTLMYPKETKGSGGVIPGEFVSKREDLTKPVSIHIFTADEMNLLTEAFDRMTMIWYVSMPLFFFGSIFLILLSYVGRRSWRMEPVAVKS